MKIHGKSVEIPEPLVVSIPRGEEDSIDFVCKTVLDYKPFDDLYPEIPVPVKQVVGQGVEKLYNDPSYVKRNEIRAEAKSNWMVLQSLSATPGLEWETVNMSDPTTFGNYEKELHEVFSPFEANLIISKVMEANIPNEKRRKEAKERFIASQRETKDSHLSTQKDAQENTQSGEPASDSESDLQESQEVGTT